MKRLFAGIGPRKTPTEWLTVMTSISTQLSTTGWHLRSGHGSGADQAFEVGMPKSQKTVFVPYIGFNNSLPEPHYVETEFTSELLQIAADHHRYWDKLIDDHKALMARNVQIILGEQMNEPVSCVIYWQPLTNNIDSKGGTNHSLRVARSYDIPCFNIGDDYDLRKLCEFTEEVERYVEAA